MFLNDIEVLVIYLRDKNERGKFFCSKSDLTYREMGWDGMGWDLSWLDVKRCHVML